MVSMGMTRSYFKDGDIHHIYYIFAPTLRLGMSPHKYGWLGYTLSVSPSVPSLGSLTNVEQAIDMIQLSKGNPNLKSENGFFSNFSYVFAQKKISVKLDLFANYLFNMIAEVKKSSISNEYVNQNIDQAFFAGAEVQLDWLISRNFKLNTNASYVYTKNITSGTYLPQIPPAHGMLALNYRLDHKFETALTTLWAAAQNQVASGETTTAGHVIFNYDIHSTPIKVKKSYLQLFGGVDNILDKAYKNHLFSTRGLDYYEPGRNIFVKLKWGW
jgi:outer membrane receptor for ferrienterochelin and colicin